MVAAQREIRILIEGRAGGRQYDDRRIHAIVVVCGSGASCGISHSSCKITRHRDWNLAVQRRRECAGGVPDQKGVPDMVEIGLRRDKPVFLRDPAGDPVNVGEARQRRCGGFAVGCLGIVDVADAVNFADGFEAMRQPGIGLECRCNLCRRQPA